MIGKNKIATWPLITMRLILLKNVKVQQLLLILDEQSMLGSPDSSNKVAYVSDTDTLGYLLFRIHK